MKIRSTIKYTSTQSKKIVNVFALEEKEFSNNRAKYVVEEKLDTVHFLVEAKDSVAFRAVVNNISKILTIYEKTHELIQNERRITKTK